jgi:hypothetical protein
MNVAWLAAIVIVGMAAFGFVLYRTGVRARSPGLGSEADAARPAQDQRWRAQAFARTGWGRIASGLGACGFVMWLAFLGLFIWYSSTRPSERSTATGRVHEINNHGHVTYLTASEKATLDAIEGGAVGLVLTSAAIYFLGTRRGRSGPPA